MSISKLSKRSISLHCYSVTLAIIFLIFSDFLHLKIMIPISYKDKQVKVPNLVYFKSLSIASYNNYSTIIINVQI